MILRPIQGASDVALLVLYKIGGDHDPEGRSGLAHLVEHVYITAATGAEPARTADAFFRRYPSGCNAQTGDRYTVFATLFPKIQLEKELAEASARMSELRLTPADLEREVPRLLDEVTNMFGRVPALGAINNARELIRPSPRAGRKGGLPSHVRSITLDEVRSYLNRYYKPKSAIVVLAGAVDEGTARQSVMAHFASVPAGESVPPPGEPGPTRMGTMLELAVEPFQPKAEPVACLAYEAPQPGTASYAAFLMIVGRLFAASQQSGGGQGRTNIYYPLLEDPAVLGISSALAPGEAAPSAIARLEGFIADAVSPAIREGERAVTRQMFAFFLGTSDMPDFALARNPYGLALALARREQLSLDPIKLGRALDAISEADLRRTAAEFLTPARHGAAIVSPRKLPTATYRVPD